MSPPTSASPSEPEFKQVFVESCRKCSLEYKYKLEDGKLVTILCGRPDPATGKYKALSYCWETTTTVVLKCHKCSRTTGIPMRDAAKFKAIMNFVRGSNRVWIDALSINQSDPKDKAAQLPVMGDIYRHADVVSVFLLKTDSGSYEMLKQIALISAEMVKRHSEFVAGQVDDALERLGNDFSACIRARMDNLHRWKYWQRAWTFQEWAMASEIEMTYETIPGNEGLSRLKNVIVEASTIVGHWRKMIAKATASGTKAENLLKQVHLRDDVGAELNAVRSLFPFYGFLVADNEDEMDNLRSSTFLTPMPSATDSGTYVDVGTSMHKTPPLRSMVGLALSAIGTSKREATYPADLIACWASACNIKYEYDIKDSFAMALHKVVFVLREGGIRVYNFLANTDSGETDLEFLNYATAHRQRNACSGGYLFGAPIFNNARTHLPPKSNVTLQQVSKAIFKRPISWSHKSRAITIFRSVISGKADGVRLFDVAEKVEEAIGQIDSSQLSQRLLITVSIGVDDIYTMWYCNAWAIIPSTTPLQELFVARESLNGTLVLAIYKPPARDLRVRPYTSEDPREPAREAQIVAYLNTSHQRDGTYLMKSDDGGVLDIIFRTEDTPEHEIFWMPETALTDMAGEGLIPGWSITDPMSDRVLHLKISLEDRFFSLKGPKL